MLKINILVKGALMEADMWVNKWFLFKILSFSITQGERLCFHLLSNSSIELLSPANIMVQLLQPLFMLLLLVFTLIYHPRGVSSLVDYKNYPQNRVAAGGNPCVCLFALGTSIAEFHNCYICCPPWLNCIPKHF